MTWGEYIEQNSTTQNYEVYVSGSGRPSKVTIIKVADNKQAFLIHCGVYDGFTNQKVSQYTPVSKLKKDSMYRNTNLWELDCIVEEPRTRRRVNRNPK